METQYDAYGYRIIAPGALAEILERHRKWVFGEVGGDRARLDGASLDGARLGGWTILNIGPIGSRNATLTYKRNGDFEEVMTGCFRGTLAEFEAAVAKTHGDNVHAAAYRRAVAVIREMCPIEIAEASA